MNYKWTEGSLYYRKTLRKSFASDICVAYLRIDGGGEIHFLWWAEGGKAFSRSNSLSLRKLCLFSVQCSYISFLPRMNSPVSLEMHTLDALLIVKHAQ